MKENILLKRILTVVILSAILFASLTSIKVNRDYLLEESVLANEHLFDMSEVENGILITRPLIDSEELKYKITVKKDRSQIYNMYNIPIRIPLTDGEGVYNIKMYIITEDVALLMYDRDIDVEAIDDSNLYLEQTVSTYWNKNMELIEYFNTIIESDDSDKDIANKVRNYMIENYRYDYSGKVEHYYNPDIEKTFRTNLGTCSDFASTFGSLMRYYGVQCKYIEGYAKGNSTRHAWNEVLIDGEWKTIDLTYDIVNSDIFSKLMFKPSEWYEIREVQ